MFVRFTGKMRSKEQDWFSFQSEQYSFFDEPTRLFFMKGEFFGLTVPGYHHYENGRAGMEIKLFGLIPVVQVSGDEISKGETVTLFNDMCLLAPASLLDPRIQWKDENDHSVRAIFTHGPHVISAVLYFNKQGQLVNFKSDDRYDVNLKQFLPFSTPVAAYQVFGVTPALARGEAVWHYPEGAFTYGEFDLQAIEFNVSGP
jgi:hypothetical protein